MTPRTDLYEPEGSYNRLQTARQLVQRLRMASDDPLVWTITLAVEQLAMGTLTCEQALAQVEGL